MKLSNVFIAGIWVVFLAGAVKQGLTMPYNTLAPPGIESVAPFLLLFPFVFLVPMAFFQRKRYPFDVVWMRKWIDRKLGVGTYDGFFARLKPVTLFMFTCLALGFTGLISTYATTQSFSGYFHSGFVLSGGLGLLVAYFLSVKFPSRLE